MDIIEKLENFKPIKDYCFGHTPLQIEHFQTNSHKGSRKFEYWQHVLQLKGLYRAIKELDLDFEEAKNELVFRTKWWAFWRSRKKVPRLTWKVELLGQTLKEKSTEADRHLKIIDEKYFDLKTISEEDILKEEENYWITRLSRQMAFANLANKFHLPVGDITAVMGLPNDLQQSIFDKAANYIKSPETAFLTDLKDRKVPKVLEEKKDS